MSIIQSLIASLEKNNNKKLIEKLEILEKFVSSEESNKLSTEALNKLISDRIKSNNKQEGIKDVKEEDTTILSKSDESKSDESKSDESKSDESKSDKEVIESENIMSKFKWVLLGIGIFVLLIFISSIIYWYMNMSSTPSEVPILQPVVTPNDTISQPSHIQDNVLSEPQEYSYIPEIFQSNSKKSEELRSSRKEEQKVEEGRHQNELKFVEEGRPQTELNFVDEGRPQTELRSSRKEEQKVEEGRPQTELRSSRKEEQKVEEGRPQTELRSSRKEEQKVEEGRPQNELRSSRKEEQKVEERRPQNELRSSRKEEQKVEEVQGEEKVKEVQGEEIERKEEIEKVEEIQEERRSQKEKMFQKEKISLREEKEDILKNKGYKLSSKSNFPL